MKNIIEIFKKQIVPISILLGSIIIGGFLYVGITEKQHSINLQNKKEYIGKRKMECYEIFERERKQDRYGSVSGVKYYEPSSNPFEGDEYNDSCRVEYKYLITNPDGTKKVETDYKSF